MAVRCIPLTVASHQFSLVSRRIGGKRAEIFILTGHRSRQKPGEEKKKKFPIRERGRDFDPVIAPSPIGSAWIAERMSGEGGRPCGAFIRGWSLITTNCTRFSFPTVIQCDGAITGGRKRENGATPEAMANSSFIDMPI
jgi:hypothetical protein